LSLVSEAEGFCVRGLRISVYDVLAWFADGILGLEIIEDYPELSGG